MSFHYSTLESLQRHAFEAHSWSGHRGRSVSYSKEITTVQMKTAIAHFYTSDILNYLLDKMLSSDELYIKPRALSFKLE